MAKESKLGLEADLPDDIKLLLEDIAQEPVPDRLLELATRLQMALSARRQVPDSAGDRTEEARD